MQSARGTKGVQMELKWGGAGGRVARPHPLREGGGEHLRYAACGHQGGGVGRRAVRPHAPLSRHVDLRARNPRVCNQDDRAEC
eukprot:1176459-Prorocentrum_minimum.AAC.2